MPRQKIEFKFDANQEHQKRAVESVLGLFEGFPKGGQRQIEILPTHECIPNVPPDSMLDEDILFSNMQKIQYNNDLSVSPSLNIDEGYALPIESKIRISRYPFFTVEMETGTGKTYTYLRTIYELRRQFGFGKFIIVVPSVAIYEGVIKAIEITREHFRTLYHNEYLHLIKYDGSQLGQLRDFSHSQYLTVMVMTIAAFNKTSNNIFKPTEKLMGEKLPYEYIQEVRPIFILDECQNYESSIARQAIRTLNPLLALKYSATAGIKVNGEWSYDNLIYRLDPMESFRRNLVKRIQVFGVTEGVSVNTSAPFVIKEFLQGPKVKAEVTVNKKGRRETGCITLKKGDDLAKKTKNTDYAWFVVENIDLTQGLVEFANGERFQAKTEMQEAEEKKTVFKKQIQETVRQHMNQQAKLAEKNIKVLSLFFIDRVANYRGENALIRQIFEEIFNKYKDDYSFFKNKQANAVHDGYFAQKQTKDGIEEIDIGEEGGSNEQEREAAKRAFELIMQKKEQLLSFDEDVSFIFAHSALKEGWDNPNVFQICTLAQRYSERRKRQEIGRGMRLCVDQAGDRIQDPKVNVLTVIANESYEDFVKGLQTEYAEEGSALPPPPTRANREPAKRNDKIYRRKEFSDFWNKLIKKTDYSIQVNTDEVIKNVIAEFNKEIVSPPDIIVKKGEYISVRYEMTAEEIGGDWAKIKICQKSSDGNDEEIIRCCKIGDDLSKELKDKALDGYTVDEIREKEIAFANKEILRKDACVSFETTKTALISQSVSWERERVFPVFNLIDRVAEETSLTRKTVIEIFNGIAEERRKSIFHNPEGFASAFIFKIKEVLSDHVAKNIEYFLQDEFEHYNLENIFPPEEKHPQRELIKGSEASLYDLVQCESGVETNFVKDKLNNDRKVILYFKFPDSFKVKLPKIIGNYVPDWGIVRKSEDGGYSIELVRETKATLYENLLQFTNEKRKIWCAKKHFKKIDVDYRHISDIVERWWEPDTGEPPAAQEMFEDIPMVDDIDDREKFVTHLPVYSLEAVATNFGKEEFIEQLGWVKADVRQRLTKEMFVAKIVGKSMEPTVKDGSWGIFRIAPAGTREGNIVLVNCNSVRDPESDGTYTLKRYHSEKENLEDGTWRHKKIVLSPDNKDFDDIVLENIPEGDFQVTAELLRLL